uniref:Uncharacterized protein n=1 Tax=Arundo donax TaxID=35708 RepID=A0A0A9A162_ARUDO
MHVLDCILTVLANYQKLLQVKMTRRSTRQNRSRLFFSLKRCIR